MLVYRTTVAGAAFAGALLLGCTPPDQPTDLRTDGPPHVTTVVVMSDLRTSVDPEPPTLSRLLETSTFCRANDAKRPGLVGLPDVGLAGALNLTQTCPEDLTKTAETQGTAEAAPPTWFIRVVFDMLLDPTVEDLIELKDAKGNGTGVFQGSFVNTQPVTLKCNGTDVAYNGYYVPNGNRVSWPLGPGLFVQPLAPAAIPTDAACTIAMRDNVRNKRGDKVADDASFPFKIAPMKLRFSAPDPADSPNGKGELDPAASVSFFWTAAIGTLPAPADIKIFSGANTGTAANTAVCAPGGGTAEDPATFSITKAGTGATTSALVMRLALNNQPGLKWAENTTYRIEFASTASVGATQGGPAGTFPASYSLCFHTTAAM